MCLGVINICSSELIARNGALWVGTSSCKAWPAGMHIIMFVFATLPAPSVEEVATGCCMDAYLDNTATLMSAKVIKPEWVAGWGGPAAWFALAFLRHQGSSLMQVWISDQGHVYVL